LLFSLFSLFSQEIISERPLVARRNPGVPAAGDENNSGNCRCSVAVPSLIDAPNSGTRTRARTSKQMTIDENQFCMLPIMPHHVEFIK
jgi:hypothetical protein